MSMYSDVEIENDSEETVSGVLLTDLTMQFLYRYLSMQGNLILVHRYKLDHFNKLKYILSNFQIDYMTILPWQLRC